MAAFKYIQTIRIYGLKQSGLNVNVSMKAERTGKESR